MELPDLDVGETAMMPFAPADQALCAAVREGARSPGSDGADEVPNPAAATAAKEQLRARRALLRNAMEMAVQGEPRPRRLWQRVGSRNRLRSLAFMRQSPE